MKNSLNMDRTQFNDREIVINNDIEGNTLCKRIPIEIKAAAAHSSCSPRCSCNPQCTCVSRCGCVGNPI